MSMSFVSATDTTNMQAGGKSFFDSASDALTYGAGGAALSGLYSIANTAIDFSNKVFGTETARADTSEALHNVDQNWGNYYDEHKEVIDTAGFVATSLIPGTLAIKGLKLLQTGNVAGAFGRALGYTNRMENFYLQKSLQAVAEEGGTVFTRINSSKLASIAWGTADQVLQTAAFETGVALTMKSSPMLDNETWGHIGKDMLSTSLIGGAFGGAINGLLINKTVKDFGKLVENKQRTYDHLALVAGDNANGLNLATGDKIMSFADSVMSLPKEIFEADKSIVFDTGNKALPTSWDTSKLMNKTLQDSYKRGLTRMQESLQTVVQTDATIGTPMAEAFTNIVKEGLEGKVDPKAIKDRIGDFLYNLRAVEGIGSRPLDVSGELRFLDTKKSIGAVDEVFSSVRPAGDHVQAYRVVADEGEATMGALGRDGATMEDAFKAQNEDKSVKFHTVIDPDTGRVRVNPASHIYQQVDQKEIDFTPMFFNTKTMQTSFDTVPTIADVATLQNPLAVSLGGVQAGSKNFAFTTAFKTPDTSLEATARHLWANGLNKISGDISSSDIALLSRVVENPQVAMDGLRIVDAKTGGAKLVDDILDMKTELYKAKYNGTVSLLEKSRVAVESNTGAAMDIREIAYRMNVSPEWVQEAVVSKMDINKAINVKGWDQPLASLSKRENLVFRYDTAAKEAAKSYPEAEVAWNYRVQAAQTKANDASASVLGADFYKQLPDVTGEITKMADSSGTGATLFGASNANYSDKLKNLFQYVGQLVATETTNRGSTALAQLQAPATRLLQNPIAAAEVSAAVTAGRLSTDGMAIMRDPGFSRKYMMVDLASYKKFTYEGGEAKFAKRIDLSDEAGEFIQAHHDLHQTRIEQQKTMGAAQGQAIRWDADKLYFPPIDTQRVPFFAFVRQSDGTLFGSSEVAMITGRDAAELASRAAQAEKIPGMSVIYKSETEAYHKAKGDYDFSRTMNEPVLDSSLRKQGILGDFMPNMTPEAVVNDFVQYTQRAETKLVRDAVSLKYSQEFAQLQDMSDRYTAAQTSKFEGLNKWLKGSVNDPFGDYNKLALNISKRGEFTLLHQANEFVDALGTRAFRGLEQAFLKAKGGQITWEEANAQLQKFGLGAHYTEKEVFEAAQSAPDRNLLHTAIQKANMLLSTGMLRLDMANGLLNIISTPILLGTELSSIRNSLKNDPELLMGLSSQLSNTVPGTAIVIPSATKAIFNAVADFARGDKQQLMDRFKSIGTVKGPAALMHEMNSDLSLIPNIVPSEFAKKVEGWVEKGATLTGNNKAEDLTRYVTSHVMWQITDPLVQAGKMTEQEANAYISTFTNRVQGNYVASQRPIAFQGTLGSAVGLFQTYQFNLFQQLFRHIENKDMKTIATMGALQGSIFGLNGLPMFDAINTHIVGSASINEKHKDAYSYAVSAAGKDIGDWMLYGTASAFPLFSEQAPALWTRGDLNPRSTFILPTNPADVPAVAASLKVVNGVLGMAKQIGNGAGVTDSLLFGMEHNGLNRPLAGLAQVLKGNSTTSKGDLISASSDWLSIASAARILGAKPMDESVALTTMFRSKAYQALDKDRLDTLGAVVKDKLRNNQQLTSEDWVDFQGRYAAAGGRVQGFTQAVQRWDKGANTSIVNEVMRHTQTPAGQRMIEVMGGDPLTDYRNMTGAE